MTDPVHALVETWRRRASENGAIYAQGIDECADELEAALRALPSEPAKDALTAMFEVEDPCKYCGGLGRRIYSSTSTWRGGVGGSAMTQNVCDHCWGSGEQHKPWPSWRTLSSSPTCVCLANQRRQLDTLGLLGEFAPSVDLADALGEALLRARALPSTPAPLPEQILRDLNSRIFDAETSVRALVDAARYWQQAASTLAP